MIRRLLLGLLASIAISVAGWRARALTTSGAVAATGVGAATIAGTSWRGALLLGTFFVSSSVMSRIAHDTDIAAKGSRRDERQVLANGGVAAGAAFAAGKLGQRRALALVAGALAAAAADTWATEIGSTSRTAPRLIVSRRRVAPGISGGVTPRGMLAAGGGAALVGSVAGVSAPGRGGAPRIVMVVALAGFAGSVVDSVLGELIQEQRYCRRCAKPTEARIHRCGTPTEYVRGVRWVDNDLVNLACTLIGAMVAGIASTVIDRQHDDPV